MNVQIHPTWLEKLDDEFKKPYFYELVSFVKNEYREHSIFPPGRYIFEAFNQTPFDQVSVVILGQDPYHGLGQAHGLCFSVPEGIKAPPSLINIFKEIQADTGKCTQLTNGNLLPWAKQGVFLLNAILTVRAHAPGSHQNKGWEQFTDAVIKILNRDKKNIVYMLWGGYAQKKAAMLDAKNNLILKAAHPSPLSAHNGFMGCKHFSTCNAYLHVCQKKIIEW